MSNRLKIEIHNICEIKLPSYRNPLKKYEIHCLKIEIHEIQSDATSAKYRNPQDEQNPPA